MPRESSPTRSEVSEAATPSPTEPETVDAVMSRILPFDKRHGTFRVDFEELARLDLEDGEPLSPAMRQAIRVYDAYQLTGDRKKLEFRLEGIERVLRVDEDDAERYVDWCGGRLEEALGDVYEQPGAVRQALDSALEDDDFADVIESVAREPARWGALRISSPDSMTKHTIYEMRSCYDFGPRTASEGMRSWSRGTVAYEIARYHLARAQKAIHCPEEIEVPHDAVSDVAWLNMTQYQQLQRMEARLEAERDERTAMAQADIEELRTTRDLLHDELREMPTRDELEQCIEDTLNGTTAQGGNRDAFHQAMSTLHRRTDILEDVAVQAKRHSDALESKLLGFYALYGRVEQTHRALIQFTMPQGLQTPPAQFEAALKTLHKQPDRLGTMRTPPRLTVKTVCQRASRWFAVHRRLGSSLSELPIRHMKRPLTSQAVYVSALRLQVHSMQERLRGISRRVQDSRHLRGITRGFSRF
jgi:hypothetical protein